MKEQAKIQARVHPRVSEAMIKDPDWAARVREAWKLLTHAKDGEEKQLVETFENLLREKGLL